jgi:cytochrome c553
MAACAVNARRALLLLVAGALVLAVIMVAGGYNVSAAAGHLPPVQALLHWTMQNSVTVRARTPAPEDLDSDVRAMAGAGHYDLVCRDCHGAPGVPLTAVAKSLEPPPPHILDAVAAWQPDELFWIVKHGIKMTAMPAWPSQHRDDEVWSMVAFLKRLPGMDADTYQRAVRGPPAGQERPPAVSAFDAELERCARCHGYDGRGMATVAFPRLDGQSATYLRNALQAFAAGERASGIMQAHATEAPRGHFEDLARHYAEAGAGRGGEDAGARPSSSDGQGDARRGERIAREGLPRRRVPACAACHGPASYPLASAYPRLAGQPAPYIEAQLRLFRDGYRGGSEFAGIMTLAAEALEDRDIVAVADYYASLDGAEVASAHDDVPVE